MSASSSTTTTHPPSTTTHAPTTTTHPPTTTTHAPTTTTHPPTTTTRPPTTTTHAPTTTTHPPTTTTRPPTTTTHAPTTTTHPPTTTTHPATTTTHPATTTTHPATTTTRPATTTTHPATTTTHPATTTTHPATTTTHAGTTTTHAGTTTTHPATTTTHPATTTTHAGTTTTHAGTTTTHAGTTTTHAGTTTTHAGTTTTHPAGTTTAPGGTTTAPGGTTTAGTGPSFTNVEVEIDPDEGGDHHAHSVQVAKNAKLKLKWGTSNATKVHDEALGDLDASGETDLATEDKSYSLVAKNDAGAESPPWLLDIHTHEPGDVVSQHIDLSSNVAQIAEFKATKDGQIVDSIKPGDQIKLTAIVSDGTDAVKIAGQDAQLEDNGDGHHKAEVDVTVASGSDGKFEAQALKGGNVGDTQTLHLDVAGGPSSTTTHPAGTTTAPAGTTTHPAGTTTAPAGTTTHPTGTTTAPAGTTTAPTGTTTHPAGTTTHPATTTTGGGANAVWSVETVKLGDKAQMKVTGFAPNAQISFEVTMANVGVIATPDAVAADASGAASVDFGDWFSAAKAPNDPPQIPDGQAFPAATFTFKATAGSQSAETQKPVTYADSLDAQCVSHDDGSPLANTPYTLESPWGTRNGTTDDQGHIKVDNLPPGGVRITIAGDVLTSSDAG